MNNWNYLKSIQEAYGLELRTEEASAVLTDAASGRSVEILEESFGKTDPTDGSYKILYDEYIVCFSTQHVHLAEPDDVAAYVRAVLEDEVLPIEFYLNGQRRFGGEIGKADLARLSTEFLSEQFGITEAALRQYEYALHSWSGRYDSGRRRVADLNGH